MIFQELFDMRFSGSYRFVVAVVVVLVVDQSAGLAIV